MNQPRNVDILESNPPSIQAQRTIHEFFYKRGQMATPPTPVLISEASSKKERKRKMPPEFEQASKENDTNGAPQPAPKKAAKAFSSSSKSKTAESSSRDAPASRTPKPERGNPRGVVSQLTDALGDDLLVMFVGVNPGIRTAETGHAYAHKTNHFWRLLHASRLTPRLCLPKETHDLVPWLRLGNTNLVARPTKDASTLSKAELDAGVMPIETKARVSRARVVCLVGKGIWEAVERVWRVRGRRVAPFGYGWRPDDERMGKTADWEGSRVFVATTTSALAAHMSWDQKLAVWEQLGTWVAEQRKEEGESNVERGDGAAVEQQDQAAKDKKKEEVVSVEAPNNGTEAEPAEKKKKKKKKKKGKKSSSASLKE